MIDPVNSWKQTGEVYLWRYRDNVRNYPGWHMTATKDAARRLFELLSEFAKTTAIVRRTVAVSPPTPSVLSVPNNQGGRARWLAPTHWSIAFDPSPDAAQHWSFPPGQDPAVLTIGTHYLSKLTCGVLDTMKGEGDYSIGERSTAPSENAELWFWWFLSSRTGAA